MSFSLKDGVWPTMVTPFKDNKSIDWNALELLMEWYIEKGIDGVFAVCQSSEMFFLSLEERVNLARFIVKIADGRCGVIGSGHISYAIEEQIKELNAMAETDVDAVVLVANRLADVNDYSDIWINNLEYLLNELNEDIPLGLYECPYPYKRILLPQEIEWLAKSGRFYFIKDTCGDSQIQSERALICKDSPLKLYNANSATLLSSLNKGYKGFCGVMGNFHPELYSYLINNKENDKVVFELSNFLGFSSVIEHQAYPVNAKYYLSLEGIPLSLTLRNPAAKLLSGSMKDEIEEFRECNKRYIKEFIGS